MPGGVAGRLAFYPAVPGLAPGAFMGAEAERASGPEAERLAGGDEIAVRGDRRAVTKSRAAARIKALGASRGTATWCTDRLGYTWWCCECRAVWLAGWTFTPPSPGSRPGLLWSGGGACTWGRRRSVHRERRRSVHRERRRSGKGGDEIPGRGPPGRGRTRAAVAGPRPA